MAEKDRSWLPLSLAFILAILTYVSFYPSIENGWTDLDNGVYVTNDPLIQKNETSWKEIFTTPVAGNYHPLTILTLAWNYQSARKQGNEIDAHVFHEWNVWLHILNTLLVFYFIWLLSGGQLITAVFTAGVFGVHPMHVESVSWIIERKDVLYTFFFLLSCITYLRYLDRKKALYLVLSFIFFILSCLSEAMAVVIPVVFLAIDYFRSRKWEWGMIIEKVPFLLLSVCFGIKAIHLQSASIADVSWSTLYLPFLVGSYDIAMYILKFFFPFSLSAFYPYPGLPIPFFYYVAPVVWLALNIAWIGYKKNRALGFGIVFFLINVIPVLQFIPESTASMADRYTYIPYIGLAFIIGSLCYTLVKKYPVAAIATYLLCSLFIIFLSVQTYSRTQVWKNNHTLWADILSKYPNAKAADNNLNFYYKAHVVNTTNMRHANYNPLAGKIMNPKDSRDYNNEGNFYRMRYQLDSAIWAYNRSLSLDSNYEDAYMNRGLTYLVMKQYDNAIADFNKQEKLAGVTVQLLQNRANTYMAAGKYSQSLDDYNKLIQLKPGDGLLYNNRAMVNEQLNNHAQAYADLQKAASLGFKVDIRVMQRVKDEISNP